MEFRLLGEREFPAIHETFLDAFADYEVQVDFDAGRLRRMMVRRGTELGASVGAFEDDRMVAVMATAIRDFEGTLTAYDTFTGVRPAFRGQGLAGKLFDVALEELEGRGVRRFLLEVIQSNKNAVKAYERAGFVTRRHFDCFELSAAELAGLPAPDGFEVREGADVDRQLWASWRDWSPSWQNSDASVDASIEQVVFLEAVASGDPVGGAVVVPQARDLPQIMVAPDCRRRGVGSALLAAAVRLIDPDATLRVINVEASATADQAFLRQRGAHPLPSQFEMVLEFPA
jgi:ribosomal protein S18 acetylase RimI-like enzyme